MPLYFLLQEPDSFLGVSVPALAAARRQRDFAPCRALAAALLPKAQAYTEQNHTGTDESFLGGVVRGVGYDLQRWRLLVGEVLLYGAIDVPLVVTAPETLAALLAPGTSWDAAQRDTAAPVWQAHYGSQDLLLGGHVYRPDAAGWNGRADVVRLCAYLDAVDTAAWSVDALSDEDAEDELAYARDCWEPLCALYRRAAEHGWGMVCEREA